MVQHTLAFSRPTANRGYRAAKVVAQSRVRLIMVGVSIGVAIRIQEPRLTYNGIVTATCVANCIMDYSLYNEISNCACANG